MTRKVDAVISRGIRTTSDLRDLMAATMCDVLTGDITPYQAKAASAVVGKLLKRRRIARQRRVSTT